jgi:hypothetical protein
MPKNTSVQGQKKKRFPTNKRIKTAIQEIELKNQTVRAISWSSLLEILYATPHYDLTG